MDQENATSRIRTAPKFSQSIPVQTTSLGVMLATATIMTLHLIFTAPYHYPLSKANFILQLVAAILFLSTVSASLGYLLWDLSQHAAEPPYMIPYLADAIPPNYGRWTTVQVVFFVMLQSSTVFMAHVRLCITKATHIQFLVLLFPSSLETWLIMCLLGPLALVQFASFYINLSLISNVNGILGPTIQEICESTLSLLYTSALFSWGTMVNRHRAWRIHGVAALFGAAALLMALFKTVISFVQIYYERAYWIMLISWSLTIWQSWLGFWWWVSAGMVCQAYNTGYWWTGGSTQEARAV